MRFGAGAAGTGRAISAVGLIYLWTHIVINRTHYAYLGMEEAYSVPPATQTI